MSLDPESVVAPESWGAGHQLRDVRQRLGFTLQKVEALSERIALALKNPEFSIPYSRLSQIETRGLVPSIYRIYSLARIYGITPDMILEWYGIKTADLAAIPMERPAKSGLTQPSVPDMVNVPISLDPAFTFERSASLRRVVEKWGAVPFSALKRLQETEFLYGFVGLEDFTMYPILPPGSFVQVDGTKRTVKRTGWRGEYDRPIYAVETRQGLHYSWCSVTDRKLVLEPHPLSSVELQMMPLDEVDIIGQVVGAAIRIGGSLTSL